jgi:hypothetical protein
MRGVCANVVSDRQKRGSAPARGAGALRVEGPGDVSCYRIQPDGGGPGGPRAAPAGPVPVRRGRGSPPWGAPQFPARCPLGGVAALELRASVAAVGHVVAPLQRGYVPPATRAAKMAALRPRRPGKWRLQETGMRPARLPPTNFPLANLARALCFRPLSPCKRPKSPLPSASS